MKVSTEDIIKMLPFDDGFKTNLLNSMDGYDLDRKMQAEQLLWEAYDLMYEYVLQKNLADQLDQAKAGEIELNKDFYSIAEKKTDNDIKKMFFTETAQADLSAIRQKLQGLVNAS